MSRKNPKTAPDAPVDGADATKAPDAPEAAIDPPAELDQSAVGHFPVEMMLEGCAVRRANWAPGWTLVIGTLTPRGQPRQTLFLTGPRGGHILWTRKDDDLLADDWMVILPDGDAEVGAA